MRVRFTRLANFPISCLLKVSFQELYRTCGEIALFVDQANFHVVQRTISELLSQVSERILELVLQLLGIGTSILRTCCSHVGGAGGICVLDLSP
jgi:hypothetical protein